METNRRQTKISIETEKRLKSVRETKTLRVSLDKLLKQHL